jgi:hypothetical protein
MLFQVRYVVDAHEGTAVAHLLYEPLIDDKSTVWYFVVIRFRQIDEGFFRPMEGREYKHRIDVPPRSRFPSEGGEIAGIVESGMRREDGYCFRNNGFSGR